MARKGAQIVKKENKNIFFKVIGIINIIISLVFIGYVFSLNIIPNKYFYTGAIVVIIFEVLLTTGIVKERKNKIINLILVIFAILISGAYIFVYDYSKKGFEFVDTISKAEEQVEEYYIVTLKENEYKKVDDIKSKKIFKFVNTLDDFDIVEELVERKKIKFSDYSNLHLLKDDLINKKIDAVLISSSEYNILQDEDPKFKDLTSKIYSAKHKISVKDNLIEKNDEFTISKGKFNVYVSGIDTSGSINNVSRTDANILVTINVDTREILLTSIPRDYYVTLHSKKAKDKLTHSGVYGINETVMTVEDLLDTDINYYARVNFTTVIKLIDVIGGINVYSDFDFSLNEDKVYSFKKGWNYLNGEEALAFCRERHSFASGDNQRIKNQQKVIEAVIKKLTSSTALLTKYNSILKSLSRSLQTNVDREDISYLVKEQLDDMRGWNITTNVLTGKSAKASTFSLGAKKLYVMIPNESSVSDAKNKINSVLKK